MDLHTPHGISRYEFQSMGTTVRVLAPEEIGEQAFHEVSQLFSRWHQALTRFDPRSELSRLNSSAGLTVLVSPLLFEVLARALAAARATEGVFDPCLLPQLLAAGYDRTFTELDPLSPSPPPPGPGGRWRQVRLDEPSRTVQMPPGTAFDLGGIAKGMAVDAALKRLGEIGGRFGAVEAGGDLAVLGTIPGGGGWTVALEDAGDFGASVVELHSGALATSTVLRRRWFKSGQIRHHLIDPRTGLPSQSEVVTASVAAPSCAEAEVAAKLALILGPERGLTELTRLGLEGRLVLSAGTQVQTPLWPRSEPAQGQTQAT
ncbi:MAG TPA: FAD:protein FMN transferase [Candidatus Nitrosotalea sp.]|nr:FAD:protein FMN transferase [Candidatus Nitrosotalea sp.]